MNLECSLHLFFKCWNEFDFIRLARFAGNTPVEVKTEKPKVVSLKAAKRPSADSISEDVSPAKVIKKEPISPIKVIKTEPVSCRFILYKLKAK